MPKSTPGEKPTRKVLAASTGEVPKGRRILRTVPAAPAMPGTKHGSPRGPLPQTPLHHVRHDPSEIDDTTDEE